MTGWCRTVAGAGLQLQDGLTERDALSVLTLAAVQTRRLIWSVFRRRTLTAVSCPHTHIMKKLQEAKPVTFDPLVCALTCAVRVSFAGGADWLLANLTCGLEHAVFAARTVPVTEHR